MRYIFLAFLLAVAACGGSGMLDPSDGTPPSAGPPPTTHAPAIAVQCGRGAGGDRHAIALDRDSCLLYETYDPHWDASGYRAGSGAIFDLRTGALRKDGWTSATASGLPILPGLARYDEAAEQKEIRHALTFTAA